MKSQANPRESWSAFPVELWSKVLVHVYQGFTSNDSSGYIDQISAQRYLPDLYQLKFVCKRLHSAFVQEPWLHRDIVIQAKGRRFHELILWAEQHHGSVENVVALADPGVRFNYINPFTDSILVALQAKKADCSGLTLLALKTILWNCLQASIV